MRQQTVYLIRHGQVESNILNFKQELTTAAFNARVALIPDEPLTPLGREQVEAIVDTVAGFGLSKLYVSPLPRAQQTAAILAEGTGLPLVLRDDIYELPTPPLISPAERIYPLRQAYLRCGMRLFSPWTRDTETVYAAYRRIRDAWLAMTAETPTDFGIVGHQGIFRLLFMWVRGSRHWRLVVGDTHNAGISIIQRINN